MSVSAGLCRSRERGSRRNGSSLEPDACRRALGGGAPAQPLLRREGHRSDGKQQEGVGCRPPHTSPIRSKVVVRTARFCSSSGPRIKASTTGRMGMPRAYARRPGPYWPASIPCQRATPRLASGKSMAHRTRWDGRNHRRVASPVALSTESRARRERIGPEAGQTPGRVNS